MFRLTNCCSACSQHLYNDDEASDKKQDKGGEGDKNKLTRTTDEMTGQERQPSCFPSLLLARRTIYSTFNTTANV